MLSKIIKQKIDITLNFTLLIIISIQSLISPILNVQAQSIYFAENINITYASINTLNNGDTINPDQKITITIPTDAYAVRYVVKDLNGNIISRTGDTRWHEFNLSEVNLGNNQQIIFELEQKLGIDNYVVVDSKTLNIQESTNILDTYLQKVQTLINSGLIKSDDYNYWYDVFKLGLSKFTTATEKFKTLLSEIFELGKSTLDRLFFDRLAVLVSDGRADETNLEIIKNTLQAGDANLAKDQLYNVEILQPIQDIYGTQTGDPRNSHLIGLQNNQTISQVQDFNIYNSGAYSYQLDIYDANGNIILDSGDSTWLTPSIDLSQYAGQNIKVILRSKIGGNEYLENTYNFTVENHDADPRMSSLIGLVDGQTIPTNQQFSITNSGAYSYQIDIKLKETGEYIYNGGDSNWLHYQANLDQYAGHEIEVIIRSKIGNENYLEMPYTFTVEGEKIIEPQQPSLYDLVPQNSKFNWADLTQAEKEKFGSVKTNDSIALGIPTDLTQLHSYSDNFMVLSRVNKNTGERFYYKWENGTYTILTGQELQEYQVVIEESMCRQYSQIFYNKVTRTETKVKQVDYTVIITDTNLSQSQKDLYQKVKEAAYNKYREYKGYGSSTSMKSSFVAYNATTNEFMLKVKRDDADSQWWWYKVQIKDGNPYVPTSGNYPYKDDPSKYEPVLKNLTSVSGPLEYQVEVTFYEEDLKEWSEGNCHSLWYTPVEKITLASDVPADYAFVQILYDRYNNQQVSYIPSNSNFDYLVGRHTNVPKVITDVNDLEGDDKQRYEDFKSQVESRFGEEFTETRLVEFNDIDSMTLKIRSKDSKTWHYYEYNSGTVTKVGTQYDVDADIFENPSIAENTTISLNNTSHLYLTQQESQVLAESASRTNFLPDTSRYACVEEFGELKCIQSIENYYKSGFVLDCYDNPYRLRVECFFVHSTTVAQINPIEDMPTLWQGVSDAVFKARDAAQGFINALRAEVYGKSFLGQASSYGGMLVNFIKGLIIGVGQDIKGQLELIWNLVTDGWNTVKDLINGIISIIKNPALLLNIFTQVFDNMQGKDIYGQIQEIGKWIGETFADAIYGPLAALTVNTGLASNISKVLGSVSDQVKNSDKVNDILKNVNNIIDLVPDDIINIIRKSNGTPELLAKVDSYIFDKNGLLVWLEKGNTGAGLKKILEIHGEQIYKALGRIYSDDELIDLIIDTVGKADPIYGIDNLGRPFWEYRMKIDENKYLKVLTGDNGYIFNTYIDNY